MIMKQILAPLALVALPLFTSAQDLPAPSPKATVTQKIGLTEVTISYSRPSMKGRQVFGGLVPYGELWRTGANECTVLKTTGPLAINGGDQVLPAGEYAVFTIPGEEAWQVVFNKNAKQWGTGDHKREEDVLTVKAAARPSGILTETLYIGFENLQRDAADLVLRWEKQEVSLSLFSDATEKGKLNIKAALAKPGADYRAYARAAEFFMDRGLDPKEALQYATKSVGLTKKYWNTFLLARAQAAVGMYGEAALNGKEAIALALAEKDESVLKDYQEQSNKWSAQASGK